MGPACSRGNSPHVCEEAHEGKPEPAPPPSGSISSPVKPPPPPPPLAAPAPGAPIADVMAWIEAGEPADVAGFHTATLDGVSTDLGEEVTFTSPSDDTKCVTDKYHEGSLACIVKLDGPAADPRRPTVNWVAGWVDFDGESLTVGSLHGDPGPLVHGDGPALADGQTLKFGDFQCRNDKSGIYCANKAHQSAARLSEAGIEAFGCLEKVTPPQFVGIQFSCSGGDQEVRQRRGHVVEAALQRVGLVGRPVHQAGEQRADDDVGERLRVVLGRDLALSHAVLDEFQEGVVQTEAALDAVAGACEHLADHFAVGVARLDQRGGDVVEHADEPFGCGVACAVRTPRRGGSSNRRSANARTMSWRVGKWLKNVLIRHVGTIANLFDRCRRNPLAAERNRKRRTEFARAPPAFACRFDSSSQCTGYTLRYASALLCIFPATAQSFGQRSTVERLAPGPLRRVTVLSVTWHSST